MRDLYDKVVAFRNDLKEQQKKIRGLSTFALKYDEKF